jgi:NTP pyrophosphatase (non-canonical NTP hydrolase)
VLGRFLKANTRREAVVVATKVFGVMRDEPNGRGLSRKAIFYEIDQSLRRLQTDYVDLYQIHRWDYETPIEETLRALDDLVKAVLAFRDQRDWGQFHNPKDLAISIMLEAAELLEHFQWKTPAEVQTFLADAENRRHVGEEMADVLILLVSMADAVGLDLVETAWAKLEENARKYPVERAKGTAKKYDQLLP